MTKRAFLILILFSTSAVRLFAQDTYIPYNPEIATIALDNADRIQRVRKFAKDSNVGKVEMIAGATMMGTSVLSLKLKRIAKPLAWGGIVLAGKGLYDTRHVENSEDADNVSKGADVVRKALLQSASFQNLNSRLGKSGTYSKSTMLLLSDLVDDIFIDTGLAKSMKKRCEVFSQRRAKEIAQEKGDKDAKVYVAISFCEEAVVACLGIPEEPSIPHTPGEHSKVEATASAAAGTPAATHK